MELNEKKEKAIAEYRCLAKVVDAMYDKDVRKGGVAEPLLKEVKEDVDSLLTMSREVGFLWQYEDPMSLILEIRDVARRVRDNISLL